MCLLSGTSSDLVINSDFNYSRKKKNLLSVSLWSPKRTFLPEFLGRGRPFNSLCLSATPKPQNPHHLSEIQSTMDSGQMSKI